MATFRRGQANRPAREERDPRSKDKRRAKLDQEFVGNVPVGDQWNVRGWPATGTECGSTMAGTRPDSVVPDRLAA